MILGRMELVERLWAQGYSAAQTVSRVNERMNELGVPPVGLRTIKRDRARLLQRFDSENPDVRAEHIEALKLVKKEAWSSFENARDTSLNKSSYLNTIRATEETIAKLDGSFQTKVTIDGTLQVNQFAMVLQKVLMSTVDSDTAEKILMAFTQEVATVDVIDQS